MDNLQLTIPKYLHCYGYCINLRLGFIIKDRKSSVSTAAVRVHNTTEIQSTQAVYIIISHSLGQQEKVL